MTARSGLSPAAVREEFQGGFRHLPRRTDSRRTRVMTLNERAFEVTQAEFKAKLPRHLLENRRHSMWFHGKRLQRVGECWAVVGLSL